MLRENLSGPPRCCSCFLSKTASHYISEKLFQLWAELSFSGLATADLSRPDWLHPESCENVVWALPCYLRLLIALWCHLRSALAALCLFLQQLSFSLFLLPMLVSQPHLLNTSRFIMLFNFSTLHSFSCLCFLWADSTCRKISVWYWPSATTYPAPLW